MASATVLTIAPRAAIAASSLFGTRDAVLEVCGSAARTALLRNDGRVAFETAAAVWDRACDLYPARAIGLRAARSVRFGAYKAYDHLMASLQTPGLALQKAATFHNILNEAFVLHVTPQLGGDVDVELRCTVPGALSRGYVEYILANLVLRLRVTAMSNFAVRDVQFAHDPPPSLDPYHDLFQAPVRFRQRTNRVVLPGAVLAIEQPRADRAIAEILEAHLNGAARRLEGAHKVFETFRRVLRDSRGEGLHSLARKAAVSQRTLQRRLQERGSTYRMLHDELRRETAIELLLDGTTTCEAISDALGFSEPSAFTRAFKRWTGQSPDRFRNRSRGN